MPIAGTRLRETHPGALVAVAVAMLAGAAPSRGAPTPDTPAPARHHVDRHLFTGPGCSARTAVPSVEYDLGRSFEGFGASAMAPTCIPARPDKRRVWSGPVIADAYVGLTYGTCDPSEGSCNSPLELQDAPQCARNPRSYEPNPWIHPESEEEEEQARESGIWDARVRLAVAPWVPVFSLETGRRVEIFAGSTTVVVFSDNAALAHRAAVALTRLIARYQPRSRRGPLDVALHDPGDGSSCRTFRGSL